MASTQFCAKTIRRLAGLTPMLLAVVLLPLPAAADPETDETDLGSLSIENLLELGVTSVSKHTQPRVHHRPRLQQPVRQQAARADRRTQRLHAALLRRLLGRPGRHDGGHRLPLLSLDDRCGSEGVDPRDLSERDYVYVWADGVHFRIRLEEDRLCALVMIGVRPDGTKELIAIEDGYRDSTESWAAVLRGLKRRGMRAPVLAVGDGALGFWKVLRDVWPETREQRCWVHRIANVLDKLPKRLHGRAKAALQEIMRAESRKAAEETITRFEADYGAKYPKAVASLRRDEPELLAFFDFPAEHWVHLRTANVIESPFATVRLRQRVTKGAGSRAKGLLMAFRSSGIRWSEVLPELEWELESPFPRSD